MLLVNNLGIPEEERGWGCSPALSVGCCLDCHIQLCICLPGSMLSTSMHSDPLFLCERQMAEEVGQLKYECGSVLYKRYFLSLHTDSSLLC